MCVEARSQMSTRLEGTTGLGLGHSLASGRALTHPPPPGHSAPMRRHTAHLWVPTAQGCSAVALPSPPEAETAPTINGSATIS